MSKEQLAEICHNISKLANSITYPSAVPGTDACGGSVLSLTEAVMGITGGLVEIANSIDHLADAIRERE